MNKATVTHPVSNSLVIVVAFVVSMLAGSLLLVVSPEILINSGEFVQQCVTESVVCLVGIGLVAAYGYSSIWSRTENFAKGLLSGLYIIIVGCLAGFSGVMLRLSEGINENFEIEVLPQLEPLWKIIVFILMGFLIGLAEESFFRGVVANLFWDKHAKDPAGVWTATIYSGLIFGLMHSMNIISSIGAAEDEIRQTAVGVLTQVIATAVIGMAFTAVYYRCKNIWVVIFLHAFYDIGALLSEGLFGGSLTEEISSYQPSMAISSALPFLIMTLVLLRKKKVIEILARDCGFGPLPGSANGMPVFSPYQQMSGEPISVQYEMHSSPKSRASLTRVIVIAVVIVVVLFTCALVLNGDIERLASGNIWGESYTFDDSGKWEGDITFGKENIFKIDYSGDYNVFISTNPSDTRAYVLLQIKQGEDVIFQENYGGVNNTDFSVHLDKGVYSLVFVYNFSEVTDPNAEYDTHVVIAESR